MASSGRGDYGGSAFPAKAPSFFKIVLDKALRDGKLEIPPAVVMKHGHCLENSVFLKVPTGAVWRIELTRSDGKTWLQKGWSEFSKFYSLNHGYLLMFSYEGDYLRFLVRIFHRNTLEIDYPFDSSHDGEGQFQLPKKELGDDVSAKILDSPRPKPRVGERKSTAKRKAASLRDRAFSRAMSFKSNNPFLVVKMQPSYISNANSLRLNVRFVKQHVCAKGVCNINLQVSGRRTWPVKCVLEVYGKRKSARVYNGWVQFVRENHLKVGDVCVFELVDKGRKVTFKVGIYRAKGAD